MRSDAQVASEERQPGRDPLPGTQGAGHVPRLQRGGDPNYLEAQRMIERYELGKAPGLRDYRNSVYTDALMRLSQVDPDSASFGEARFRSAFRPNSCNSVKT